MLNSLAFAFLLLTTSQLVIRPAAFNPALVTIPFVQIFIIPCLILSIAEVQTQLIGRSLSRNPITAYLLGFTVCFFCSAIILLGPSDGFDALFTFVKALTYYLLIVANLHNRKRIVQFGIAYTLFILFSVAVAMANYYHLVDMPGYTQLAEYAGHDPATNQALFNVRLSGATGTSSGDPNDFCLMILPALLFSGYFALQAPTLWQKLLALPTTGFLFRALLLTQSRGGMLGLLAGCATLLVLRFGIKRSIPLLVVGATGLIAMAGGRQMDFSTTSGTGHVRTQIWLSCVLLIKSYPVLGVGPGQLPLHVGWVAHNSFVQAFAELGIPGGICFLGIFFSAAWCLVKTRPHLLSRMSPELWKLRPLTLALVISTAVSMNALTRTYALETFVVVGWVSGYYRCITDEYKDTLIRTNQSLFGIIIAISAAYLVFIRYKSIISN